MTWQEIIDLLSSSILDDTDTDRPLWSVSEKVFYANEAENEICSECMVIKDETTTSICNIKLLSNVGSYAMSEKIVNVISGRSSDTGSPYTEKDENYLDHRVSNWRAGTGTPYIMIPDAYTGYITFYPKFNTDGEVIGVSNISFAVTTNTITKPLETFTAHYAVGDEINISGTTLNNGYFTLATVGTTTMTTVGALATEDLKSATLRKVEDTALLVVNRLPATPLTTATISTASPEIKSSFHGYLLDGMAKRAYLKQDSEGYDKNKAKYHKDLFEESKGKINAQRLRMHNYDHTATPRAGCL